MALHLYIFTLFGMLLFPKQGSTDASIIVDGLDIEGDLGNGTSNSTHVSNLYLVLLVGKMLYCCRT